MPVRALRRFAAAWLDDHELGAALARPLHERPDVDIGGEEIGTPGNDEVGLHHCLGIGASHAAAGRVPAGLGGGIADRPRLQPGHPERVEETEQEPSVQLPLMRAIGVTQDAEGPVRSEDRFPSSHDIVQRLVPRHRLEAPFPLRPDTLERCEHALGGMHPFVFAIDLGAG